MTSGNKHTATPFLTGGNIFRLCTSAIQAAKAAEEEMQDTMLYDGDQQRYLQLLANGGEEEVGIDASDVDSSDVASSNEIDSDSDDEADHRRPISTAAGRKRGRAAIGTSDAKSDPNPLLAEIASKSERRQAATQRWFNDPLFAGVEETLEGAGREAREVEGDAGDEGDTEEASKPPSKRSRRGAETGRRRGKEAVAEAETPELGAADALLASMPKTDKEKRKEKRKKVTKRWRNVESLKFYLVKWRWHL